MRTARTATLLVVFFAPAIASGAVQHVPIKSNIALRPGEAQTITIEATGSTEIGWEAVQAKPCTSDCVQATDLTGGMNYTIATRLGAAMT